MRKYINLLILRKSIIQIFFHLILFLLTSEVRHPWTPRITRNIIIGYIQLKENLKSKKSIVFKEQIEKQVGRKIKSLQTDNGGEFLALKSYLSTNGIVHRRSCPYSHQQMSSVERRHCHIVDIEQFLLGKEIILESGGRKLDLFSFIYVFICFCHIWLRYNLGLLSNTSSNSSSSCAPPLQARQ